MIKRLSIILFSIVFAGCTSSQSNVAVEELKERVDKLEQDNLQLKEEVQEQDKPQQEVIIPTNTTPKRNTVNPDPIYTELLKEHTKSVIVCKGARKDLENGTYDEFPDIRLVMEIFVDSCTSINNRRQQLVEAASKRPLSGEESIELASLIIETDQMIETLKSMKPDDIP